jgi:catechol 2,3-dioxygenase-like lactoylglutathione lyase family enzyme
MRRQTSILSLTVFLQAGVLWAQLAPVNELGLSWGHLHLTAPDQEKEAKAWLRLGGELENKFVGGNIPVGFPGILVLVGGPHPVSGGSAGSEVDHVAFRVPDLQASLTKWRGVKTWWTDSSNYGLKIEPGTRPEQVFVTTPAGTKVEILEDKKLKVPIVFDHVHFLVLESRLKEIRDYYMRMFGAKPLKGEANTLSMPGAKLVFTASATAPAETMGRSLDHIGFNMLNADALKAFSKVLDEKGAKYNRPYRNSALGMTRVLDGFGTIVEITKAMGGYFDPKLLDASFYQVDGNGKKEGDPSAQSFR